MENRLNSWVLLFASLAAFTLTGCGSRGTVSTPRIPTAKEWTWMSGSNVVNQSGTYGTKGTTAASNVPGARYQAVSWMDASENFWLFGGLGKDATGLRGYLNDLWKYTNGEWTWMSGSAVASQAGTSVRQGMYGTRGVAAPDNVPGARVDASSWTDADGNLWLFGGGGWDSTGTGGILNDLWKYSPSTNAWTWLSGSNKVDQFGVYKTEGVAGSGNVPGARTNAVTWIDAAGNLWLFGGQGDDSNGCKAAPAGPCELNDLWEYSPSTNAWTWLSGSNIVDEPGVYGTEGVAAPGNVPGARDSAVGWKDAAGNFWLFGGYGFDSTPSPGVFGDLNDLWKYSPTTNTWTWVSGSTKAGQLGMYGTQGTAAPGNFPGARDSAVGWIDRSGNLWLFGGGDYLSIAFGGKFNDLWEYQP
jgi:N-acetylneuraminic acid mutarotase